MRAPVAVSYVEGGQFKIHVFVLVDKVTVQPSGETQHWVLWERHYDGTRWQDWADHGPLPGTSPVVSTEPAPFRTVPEFFLTSGVVWRDHGTLRINLFGCTPDGRLVEHYWPGTAPWQYGFNVPGPNEQPFHSVSSAVYDHRDFEYITVVGVSEGIWEYYWDPRVNSNWRWRRLYP
jgi:hypothetical protein